MLSDNTNGGQFENSLENALEDLQPPENVVKSVTPWNRAMNRILLGLALCSVTLNFLCLNYILPAVGMLLLLLGFRALRRENSLFRACWIISIVRSTAVFAVLIIDSTIWQSQINSLPVTNISAYIGAGLLIAMIICFGCALTAVRKKAGFETNRKGPAALIAWYVLTCVLAVIKYQGVAAAILLTVAYIFIIINLVRLSAELDEAGYSIRAAPIKLSDRALTIVLTAAVLAGIACGYIFFSRYPMAWQPQENSADTQIQSVRDELAEAGFPMSAMDDLTDEDLLSCRGAKRILVEESDYPQADDGTASSTSEIHFICVGVELPDEEGVWKIFHFFRWKTSPAYRGTETLQLWPSYLRNQGQCALEEPSGRVLCSDNGGALCSDFYSIEKKTYGQTDLFGAETRTDSFAVFSFPRGAEDCRGYMTYAVQVISWKSGGLYTWLNYMYQTSPLQYPIQTAMDSRISGTRAIIMDFDPFELAQSGVQFPVSG